MVVVFVMYIYWKLKKKILIVIIVYAFALLTVTLVGLLHYTRVLHITHIPFYYYNNLGVLIFSKTWAHSYTWY